MRILVPVDGSPAADHAVQALVSHVASLRVSPHIDLFFTSAPVGPPLALSTAEAEQHALAIHYRNEAERAFIAARQLLRVAGLGFNVANAQGDPAEEICRAAHDGRHDMIWMGTRGMGNVANLVLGSVASKVLHRSRVPVMMVPMHPEKSGLDSGSGVRT